MKSQEFFFSWFFLFLAAFLDSFTLYLVKWRANVVGRFEFTSLLDSFLYFKEFLQHPVMILGFISFFSGPFFGYIAITRLNLTIAYPVSVIMHIIITFAFGVVLLNEQVGFYKILGIAFLTSGLFFFFYK
jgi:multidrug transporter EmrE-like cation transporter